MSLRVLYVHNHPTHFVKIDHALLRERYIVREWYQHSRNVDLVGFARAISQSDLVFGWFASWHTFWPTLLARRLRRPVVLVVGGYDTANQHEISYGNQRGGVKRLVSRTTMQRATALITNSAFTRQEAITNAGVDPNRVTTVYHGLDPTRYRTNPKKEKIALTVGNVDRANLRRKGIEPFVRAAALVPEIPFFVVGAWRDQAIQYLHSIAAPNVHFTGWLDDTVLRNIFARARVYVQASSHEGFGLAVAEAMLSECVPVVTRAGALPELVGDIGVYVDSATAADVGQGVRQALSLTPSTGQNARQRIAGSFPLERRREGLWTVIEKASHSNG